MTRRDHYIILFDMPVNDHRSHNFTILSLYSAQSTHEFIWLKLDPRRHPALIWGHQENYQKTCKKNSWHLPVKNYKTDRNTIYVLSNLCVIDNTFHHIVLYISKTFERSQKLVLSLTIFDRYYWWQMLRL